MQPRFPFALSICEICIATFFAALPVAARAQSAKKEFVSRDARIDGATIHYTRGGSGPAVILLHGFAETSRMWNPILPVLGEKFTVIAPDLPGIGDSSIPTGEMGMKTAAIEIHDLVRSLGITKARVVGHDIGLMVAYAYAAQFPSEVEKLVVMDAFLPGVPGWQPIYNDPNYWHFRFNGPTPEALVKGRENIYFAYFWDSRSRSARVSRGVFPPRAHARLVGVFRFVDSGRQGFRADVAHKVDNAGAVGRWRQVARRSAGPTDETGRHQCDDRDREKLGPLDPRGAAKADHRRPPEFPVTFRAKAVRSR